MICVDNVGSFATIPRFEVVEFMMHAHVMSDFTSPILSIEKGNSTSVK